MGRAYGPVAGDGGLLGHGPLGERGKQTHTYTFGRARTHTHTHTLTKRAHARARAHAQPPAAAVRVHPSHFLLPFASCVGFRVFFPPFPSRFPSHLSRPCRVGLLSSECSVEIIISISIGINISMSIIIIVNYVNYIN